MAAIAAHAASFIARCEMVIGSPRLPGTALRTWL
jgi:hypothetical protein